MPDTIFLVKEDELIIEIRRQFNFPRELVFNTCTDPGSIPFWWGPRELTTRVEKMEVEQGGSWRFIQNDKAGNEYAFRGEYQVIIPPEKLVYTFEFEGMPGHILLETDYFEQQDDYTLLRSVIKFETIDDLKEMINSGMESGARESWERLNDHLFKILENEK